MAVGSKTNGFVQNIGRLQEPFDGLTNFSVYDAVFALWELRSKTQIRNFSYLTIKYKHVPGCKVSMDNLEKGAF